MRYDLRLITTACFLIVKTTAALAGINGNSADGTGLQTAIAVDVTGEFSANKKSSASDLFEVREAELMLYAPIDHLFDGILSMAAHRENGESYFEIHEAAISSTKLIPRSKIRVGQFFLGIGRLNQFHRHDWFFITPPKVHETFFASEAATDTGFEYAWLAPLPVYLEATVGITNGWTYGHGQDQAEKPRKPTHYGRLMTYADLFSGGGMQLGVNYLARQDAPGTEMTLIGADLTAKWREADYMNFLFQSEVWHRTMQPRNADVNRDLGAYIFPMIGFNKEWQCGVRFDYFAAQSLKDELGRKVAKYTTAIVPTATWRPSEFSKFSLAYNYSRDSQEHTETKVEQTIEIQSVFIIGAHPAHDF